MSLHSSEDKKANQSKTSKSKTEKTQAGVKFCSETGSSSDRNEQSINRGSALKFKVTQNAVKSDLCTCSH